MRLRPQIAAVAGGRTWGIDRSAIPLLDRCDDRSYGRGMPWPKGSRPGRPRRIWLTDQRGRTYRLGPTVAFQVYFQPTEGKLWSRLYRDGQPLRLPVQVTRDEFIAEVGNVEGAYQLQPIDANGKQCGDPPAMLFLPHPPVAAASPAPTAPALRKITLDDIDEPAATAAAAE